jgi:5-methylcytosine-specific restriction endonuclease McrA
MNDIANKSCVLKLNALWQPVGYGIVADALIDLVGGESVQALDIQYILNDDGTPNFSEQPTLNPVGWDEWKTLPVRHWDLVIHSTKLTIRVPTIVVSLNYSRMPMKEWRGKPSKEAIFIRDGGKCQYTGKKLERKEMSVDHVLPRSRGGNDDWTNLVATSKEINSRKGNSLNSEIGLSLLKQPTIPRPIPVSQLIREVKHKDWELFL